MGLGWARIWLETLGPCLIRFGEFMMRGGVETEQIKVVIICDLNSVWCGHNYDNNPCG